MEVVTSAGLPNTSVIWASRSQGWVLTILCKATFVLSPGTSPLAEGQEDIIEADEHWNDDRHRSLRVPSDVVPFKPRADVLLVGTAYAPPNSSVRSLVARIVVGEVDKAIEVSQDRWFQADGTLAEGARFTRMPLVYERAGGGPDTMNPVGVRAGAPDGMGRVRVPNLTWPGVQVRAASDYVEPVGFGPLPPSWPSRREKLGALARSGLPDPWYEAQLPESFDFRYFNAAPHDQQTDFLIPGARILLENLHPAGARFTTSLASVQPFVQMEGRGGAPQPMRADTLWIDTDRLLCTVTFRAQLPLRQPDEPGEVKMWLDRPSSAAVDAPPRPARSTAAMAEEGTAMYDLPKQHAAAPEPPPPPPPTFDRALPFRPATQEMPSPVAELGLRSSPPSNVLPFMSLSASSVSAPAPAAPVSPPTFFAVPPAPPVPSAPPVAPAFVPPVSPVAVAPPAPAPWVRPAPIAVPLSASSEPAAPPAHDPSAALSGVASASDAAAIAAPRSEPGSSSSPVSAPARRRAPLTEYVDLLWFDERAPQQVRRQVAWVEHLRDPQKPVEWIVGEEPEEPTPAVLERRDIRRALGRVPPLDAVSIARVMEESVDEDGIFEQPIVVVSGELSMSYDPLETLKTTLVVASQLAGADKRLKEVLDAAQEVAAGPRGAVAPLVEGALSRVKQAFAQANRSLSPDYLETTVQRILIEERSYLRRKLLGGPHIGGLLSLTGGGAPLPTYMPDTLAEKLPLFPKFRIRAIAEPHAQQDPADTEPIALRLLSLGRTMSPPGPRSSRS